MKTIEFDDIVRRLPYRPDDAHKGTMGTLCAITGSYGFSGAAVLSAKAALRSGVGLMYQVIPESIYPIAAARCDGAVGLPLPALRAAWTATGGRSGGFLSATSFGGGSGFCSC